MGGVRTGSLVKMEHVRLVDSLTLGGRAEIVAGVFPLLSPFSGPLAWVCRFVASAYVTRLPGNTVHDKQRPKYDSVWRGVWSWSGYQRAGS